jgi:hypothetical protein
MFNHADEDFTVKVGDRIAQLILQHCCLVREETRISIACGGKARQREHQFDRFFCFVRLVCRKLVRRKSSETLFVVLAASAALA